MIPRPGFTLIELLVVITVIVVLLSLLAPALDRAIYQAELAACAAKLDAFGGAMIGGAVAHRNRFPTRTRQFMPFSVNLSNSAGANDDRPVIRQYLQGSLNAVLNDPLTKAVDIDGSKLTTTTLTSYLMWFGWPLSGERAMRKLGDRWTWDGRQFNVLAQDHAYRDLAQTFQASSHADRDGVMWNYTVQDVNAIIVSDTIVQGGETTSFWMIRNTDDFGDLDLNVIYQDGAVQRYADVPPRGPSVETDERMTTVPRKWDGNTTAGDWIRVPKQ